MRKVLLLVLVVASAVAADKQFWLHKPYDQWSADECKKMLTDSPWAKSSTLRQPTMRALSRGFGRTATADNGTGERAPEVVYTAQIRSALPLRQAYIRLKEIDAHYDSMTGDAKARAKQAFDNYLSATFDDKIVILVSYGANLPESDTTLARYWQSQTLDTVKNSAYLTGPDGERVQPTAFVTGRGAEREFQFVFPRNTAAAKAHPDEPLALEFAALPAFDSTAPQVATSNPGSLTVPSRMYFKFQPREMTVDGKVMY